MLVHVTFLLQSICNQIFVCFCTGHNRDKSVEHGWENFQPHPSFDRTPSGLMRMRSDESTRTVKDSDSDSDSCENEKGSRESLKIQTRPTRVSTQEIFDYTDKGKVEKILKNGNFYFTKIQIFKSAISDESFFNLFSFLCNCF